MNKGKIRYILIIGLLLALSGCSASAQGTNHNASIMTNILSLEF